MGEGDGLPGGVVEISLGGVGDVAQVKAPAGVEAQFRALGGWVAVGQGGFRHCFVSLN